MAEILVPVDVICEILDGVSPRRVQQLAKNGVISKSAHGQYDLVACAKALIDDAQAATSRTGDLYEQRARLVRLQGDRVETENRLRDGELIDVVEISAEFVRHVMTVKTRLLAIPTRLAPLAAHKPPAEVYIAAKSLIYEALDDLSQEFKTPSDPKEKEQNDE